MASLTDASGDAHLAARALSPPPPQSAVVLGAGTEAAIGRSAGGSAAGADGAAKLLEATAALPLSCELVKDSSEGDPSAGDRPDEKESRWEKALRSGRCVAAALPASAAPPLGLLDCASDAARTAAACMVKACAAAVAAVRRCLDPSTAAASAAS